ncbi:hypothetical protein [Lactobacillus taiwanensis]|nr:hypothetical protein [Lactobacillus taiwanensis]
MKIEYKKISDEITHRFYTAQIAKRLHAQTQPATKINKPFLYL